MLNRTRTCALLMAIMLCTGCQNIGSNSSYLLKYKKDLRKSYEDNIEKAAKDSTKRNMANEAEIYLPPIYRTNIPYSLSNHYDTRNPEYTEDDKTINQGDPVNVIINKVHLADNAEWLCWTKVCVDTAEIAVVVTVDDGRQEEPKNVLVAYEEGLKRNVDLPIADLLTYANEAYGNQPIKITVTVFEFDQLENENFKKMLGTAAAIGSALTPAYAPAWSMATQVGNFLINQNKDDVVVKFTFQVYPRPVGPSKSNVREIGMPRIQGGNYLIINSKNVLDSKEVERIHVDFGLNAYETEASNHSAVPKITNEKLELLPWPMPDDSVSRAPLAKSYVVLTVGKSPTRSAAVIIDRLDALNRKATGLTTLDARSQAGAALLGRDLDDIRSAVTWFFAEGEYANRKENPQSLKEIFSVAEDPRLNQTDKQKALVLLKSSLPTMSQDFRTANAVTTKEQEIDLSNMKKWYEIVKAKATYDPSEGRLMCKDDTKKEVECR